MAQEAATITETLFNYVNQAFEGFLSKFIVALIILLIGFILGKIAGRLLQNVLHELEINKFIKKAVRIKISLEEIIGHITQYFIYFIFIIIALEKVGISTVAFNLLAGAIILIIVLSVFLGIKDFIPNFIAGMILHYKGSIIEGDEIELNGMKGTVVHINLLETRMETKSGDLLYIPNSSITKSQLIVKRRKKK